MTNDARQWPFADPPNVLVFTTVSIADCQTWVHYVTHDEEDGAWQFHPVSNSPPSESDAAVISLAHMLKIEPRIAELADLPTGWHAWRDTPEAPWQRAPRET